MLSPKPARQTRFIKLHVEEFSMKVIIGLLILFITICYAAVATAEANSADRVSLNRQLQVDRYTGYKASATAAEVNPLLVITQINFPSHVITVHDAIEHTLRRSGYRVDWQQSAEARDVFAELEVPIVHRKLSLMTLKDAIAALTGDAWQLLIDSVNRRLIIQLHDYVPWQLADNSKIKDSSMPRAEELTVPPEQAESNRNRVAAEMSVPAVQYNTEGGNPNFFSKQTTPETNAIYRNTPATQHNSEGGNPNFFSKQTTPETNAIYRNTPATQHNSEGGNPNFFSKQTTPEANAIYRNTTVDSAEHGESSDKPLLDFTRVAERGILTQDTMDSYDEMPYFRRAQYIPQYTDSANIEMPPPNKQRPSETYTEQGLWSVRPVIKAKESVGSLDEAVIVHYSSISVKELIEILIPEGWVVHYEVSAEILRQKLVSHAESSRRSALLSLFKELNLKALFYPGQAVVLVAEKEPRMFGNSNPLQFETIDNRVFAAPEAPSGVADRSKPQLEVNAILHNAKMIKHLMDEMGLNAK